MGNIRIKVEPWHIYVRDRTKGNANSAIFIKAIRGNISIVGSISPDEARELAKTLNDLADDYDRTAEKNAQKSLPTNPGFYLAGSEVYRLDNSGIWWLGTAPRTEHHMENLNTIYGLKRLVVDR